MPVTDVQAHLVSLALYTNVIEHPVVVAALTHVPAAAEVCDPTEIICPVFPVIVNATAPSTKKAIVLPCDGDAGKVAVAVPVTK